MPIQGTQEDEHILIIIGLQFRAGLNSVEPVAFALDHPDCPGLAGWVRALPATPHFTRADRRSHGRPRAGRSRVEGFS